ncbi:MAG: hypothetical protein ACLQGP_38935 [Isosphaeraceae bacterium]
MAARSEVRGKLKSSGLLRRPRLRCNRRERSIGPVLETLEGRLLLADASPTNPVPIAPKPTGAHPTPQELGAAYQQVVAIQATTLESLGDSYREVEAAGARLAGRTAVAIDQLTAELGTMKGRQQADAINTAIRRDRHILNLGGAHASEVEQGLETAQQVEDQETNTVKIYIPDGLFTTLSEIVQEAQTEGTALARSGRRSADAVIPKLDYLGDQLTSSVAEPAAR